jgi:hypothetical protein
MGFGKTEEICSMNIQLEFRWVPGTQAMNAMELRTSLPRMQQHRLNRTIVKTETSTAKIVYQLKLGHALLLVL